MQERSSLIVYFKSPKVMKRIKKVGNITYFNKKRKYAVVYINKEDQESIVKELQSLRHIRRVDDSRLDYSPYSMESPEIETSDKTFEESSTEELTKENIENSDSKDSNHQPKE